MKTSITHNFRAGFTSTLVVLGVFGASAASAQTTFVHPIGFFDPSGLETEPFQRVAAGICGAPDGGDVLLAPGPYQETFILGKPARLTANVPVLIGVAPTTSTTLNVVSYNTHLFGDAILAPNWLDDERSPYIGIVLEAEGADFVGLQEVWDVDLMEIIVDQASYADSFYGANIEIPGNLNSGLLFLSQYAMQDPIQVYYSDEGVPPESLASKGYLQTRIEKDGFSIGLFTTHTQAEDDDLSELVRLLQIAQLAEAVKLYRVVHPSDVVIAMGDFNVPGETGEYVNAMRQEMGFTAQTLDTARNDPCSGLATECTSCADNELTQYFHDFEEFTETRLDYLLYADSFDGSVKIRPVRYEQREYEIPAEYDELCDDDGFCTRDLSDHYGVFAEFTVFRP